MVGRQQSNPDSALLDRDPPPPLLRAHPPCEQSLCRLPSLYWTCRQTETYLSRPSSLLSNWFCFRSSFIRPLVALTSAGLGGSVEIGGVTPSSLNGALQ